MQGVILAAGKGMRLHPITFKRSKAMAPIAGKPMIERVMAPLVENGVREFIIVISPDDQAIRPYFQKETGRQASYQFVVQEERLGMAHALSLAAPYLRETFMLSACDSIVPAAHIAALIAAHQTRQARATLSLMELDPAELSRSSAVELRDSEIRRIVEKPAPGQAPSNISSLPLYVFSLHLLAYLSEVRPSARGEYELQEAIQMLIEREGGVTGVLTDSRFQLTNAQDLLALNRRYLSLDGRRPVLNGQMVGANTRLLPPCRIEAGTIIGPNCTIGPYVYIEDNCRIGAKATLQEAVILRDAVIEAGRRVVGEVVGDW